MDGAFDLPPRAGCTGSRTGVGREGRRRARAAHGRAARSDLRVRHLEEAPPAQRLGRAGRCDVGDETTAREPAPLEAEARCRVGYFVKSTFGAWAAPGVCSSKYSRGPLPSTLAVSTCGKRRSLSLS